MKDSKPQAQTATPVVQRKAARPSPGKETRVQRRYGGGTGDVVAQVQAKLGGGGDGSAEAAVDGLPRGGGAPLDTAVQAKVESATGSALGDVRVHSGPASTQAADALGARAFTTGSDIHLGSGESAANTRLMAHEAAHTLHQQGGAGAQAKLEVSQPGDALEVEADRVADAAMSGGSAEVSIGAAASVQRDVVEDVRDKLSYGAFDWAITDGDATSALNLLAGLGQAELRAALGQLEQQYKTRLLDNLPAGARATAAFTRVLCAMGPTAIQPYVQDLLSYGVFDWAITDGDVRTIFQILGTLDTDSAVALYQRLGANFRTRLRTNMPRGGAMPANMRQFLYTLIERAAVELPEARQLFEVRFRHSLAGSGSGVTAADWDMDKLKLLWRQLDALPDADVSENQVWGAMTAIAGSGGFYKGSHIEIGVQASEAKMTHTVRHEIGHGVHDQLSGTANAWLQGSIDFWTTDWDTWISDLGGFPDKYQHPSEGEKPFDDTAKQAVRGMIESFTNRGNWGPTRAAPDTGKSALEQAYWAAMPDAVKNGCTQSKSRWYNNWSNFQQANGRSYFLNHWYHTPYRFGATAATAIGATGDNYTAMSEKEFFANCYAEYFEDPAGKDDHSKWGGSLPGSVKDFFTTCVVERHPYDEFQKQQAHSNTGGG
jgi:hypothetical protein